MCTTALSLFNCRLLGPDENQRRLVVDATIPCAGAAYELHFMFSVAITLGLALVPFKFLWDMTRVADDEGKTVVQDKTVVRLVAEEQHVREQVVQDLMRDIECNSRFSFLTTGYRPSHTYWECIEMLRKLSIVSVASVFGKGSVNQLFCMSFLSLAWLVLHVKHWPYRFTEVTRLELRRFVLFAFFCVIIVRALSHLLDIVVLADGIGQRVEAHERIRDFRYHQRGPHTTHSLWHAGACAHI